MSELRLLQVCNVGQILGGTAACAWTVTRALPDFWHTVHFLKPPTTLTAKLFTHCDLQHGRPASPQALLATRPDLVLLHNVWENDLAGSLPVPSLQYLHSRIRPAAADLTVCCSHWLSELLPGNPPVLWQGVPKPKREHATETRRLRRFPVVGRICTPSVRKWPRTLPAFYAPLATRFPDVQWEFVGCPVELQPELRRACGGRVTFLEAGWELRQRFHHWDALLYHHPALAESFGRTVAEAMRAGCIPIVDARGGFVEQFADGSRCGFLCESSDDWLTALEKLHDERTRREMSNCCREHADRNFSLARFRTDLLKWFHRLANQSSRG